ncbi:MAG: sodium:proton antiporter, partial [Prevotella sp.]|nr:sodium:proton antiporter [Prevotella sp.]
MTGFVFLIVAIFVAGYACIALEAFTKVNKAAVALLMCVLCWTAYCLIPGHDLTSLPESLGETAETLFFLMGAMTIVEIVDANGGFNFVRDTMKTRSKRKLLWRVAFMTFFLSAILDNLTTSIVMIMVLRKLIQDPKERLIFASMVIVAANSGGAFSPIG